MNNFYSILEEQLTVYFEELLDERFPLELAEELLNEDKNDYPEIIKDFCLNNLQIQYCTYFAGDLENLLVFILDNVDWEKIAKKATKVKINKSLKP